MMTKTTEEILESVLEAGRITRSLAKNPKTSLVINDDMFHRMVDRFNFIQRSENNTVPSENTVTYSIKLTEWEVLVLSDYVKNMIYELRDLQGDKIITDRVVDELFMPVARLATKFDDVLDQLPGALGAVESDIPF
jgi:hypothetical protein